MAKYQAEIRAMFVSVFQQDHFLHNVDMDDAIGMTLKQSGDTYETLSDRIEIGVGNGYSVSQQLEMYAVAVKVGLEL